MMEVCVCSHGGGGGVSACVRVRVCVRSHGGGGQVGVLVFELAVQSQASFLPVLVQGGDQGVHLAERRAGRHLVTGGAGGRTLTITHSISKSGHKFSLVSLIFSSLI